MKTEPDGRYKQIYILNALLQTSVISAFFLKSLGLTFFYTASIWLIMFLTVHYLLSLIIQMEHHKNGFLYPSAPLLFYDVAQPTRID